jgi:acyl-coenzyme A synthetase/AMP-(fatty) acid ligase
VAVVGREDAEWGQSVTAIVVLETGSSVTAEELIEFSRSRLSPHERPKQIEFRSTLGRSATGKLSRREL